MQGIESMVSCLGKHSSTELHSWPLANCLKGCNSNLKNVDKGRECVRFLPVPKFCDFHLIIESILMFTVLDSLEFSVILGQDKFIEILSFFKVSVHNTQGDYKLEFVNGRNYFVFALFRMGWQSTGCRPEWPMS